MPLVKVTSQGCGVHHFRSPCHCLPPIVSACDDRVGAYFRPFTAPPFHYGDEDLAWGGNGRPDRQKGADCARAYLSYGNGVPWGIMMD